MHAGQHALQMQLGLSGSLNVVLDFKGNFYRKAMNAPLTSANPDGKAG